MTTFSKMAAEPAARRAWAAGGAAEGARSATTREGTGWMGRAALVAGVAGLGMGLVALAVHLIKKKKMGAAAARRRLADQVEKKDLLPVEKGDEDLPLTEITAKRGILYGVRVIDFGTVVAAPSACRILAELGAEVIKVEPLEGDASRATFLLFESGRPHGSMFEGSNLNKFSVCLDLKTEQGCSEFKQLIAGADVLVTNIRPAKLGKLDMHYEALAADFPHLIYARLSAWGQEGPDRDYAGYDLGAFWNATGLTGLLHDEEARLYSQVPPGSGDLATSQALISGISLALVERLRTGKGKCVSTSLFHAGVWCVAPYLLSAKEGTDDGKIDKQQTPLYSASKPPHDPLHTVYRTADGEHLAVIGIKPSPSGIHSLQMSPGKRRQTGGFEDADNPVSPFVAFAQALGLDHTLAQDPAGLHEAATKAIAALPLDKAIEALSKGGVVNCCGRYLMALFAHVEPEGKERHDHLKQVLSADEVCSFRANLDTAPEGVEGLQYFVRPPYDFGAVQEAGVHGLKLRAPNKGEHTEAVKREGWFARPKQALLSSAVRTSHGGDNLRMQLPLTGCVIVELNDMQSTHVDIALSAAGRMLVEQGATVVRLEPKGGDPLRHSDPLIYEHYNAGKEILVIGDIGLDGNEQVQQLLSSRGNILLTNLSRQKLARYNLDEESLRRRLPELVVVQSHTYRSSQGALANAPHGALGAMYAASGMASSFSGKPPSNYPAPPKHVFELMISLYLLAATSLAWFHRSRTGQGQVVKMYYDNVGLWSTQVISQWLHRNPAMTDALFMPSQQVFDNFPVPTYLCHRTKDGFWVQLLGSEFKDNIAKTLAALGIKFKGWSQMIWVLFTEVLPSKDPIIISRARPLWRLLNREFSRAIASMTFDEFNQTARQHDVWFTMVRMPEQLLSYDQAKANAIFSSMNYGHSRRVLSPVQLDPNNI